MNLTLVSMPGHDWPWVTCGTCDGKISRMTHGATYDDPPEYEECACAESEHPGIEPWPEEDPLIALLSPRAFSTHSVFYREYPHAVYWPGEVPADSPF